jgi:diadenosine tetraphosphate (Ap4A) HIT family hydrolase
MTYDQNNVFARIIRGELPCRKVYEDDQVLAFHDIHPQAPVHIVVCPKGAYISMTEFSQTATINEMAALFRAVGLIVQQENLAAAGYRVITNAGPHSGQEVPHLHLHILGGRPLGPLLVVVD